MTLRTTNTKARTSRVNYTNLTFNGKQYQDLDSMIIDVAKSYAKRDFTTATLLAQSMGVDLTREELAELLIDVKKSMIKTSLAAKKKNNDLFAVA